MILYLKQSIEPGNLLFHVMDELGHPCYQVFINKHRFVNAFILRQQNREKLQIFIVWVFQNAFAQYFINGRKCMTLLCSFAASESLI